MRAGLQLEYHLIALLLSLLLFGCGEKSRQTHTSVDPPLFPYRAVDLTMISTEQLAKIGEFIIFGMEKPRSFSIPVPIGKGQCPWCHKLFKEQPEGNRAPSLFGIVGRAEGRVKEDRYRMFASRLEKGEPNSGIKPHAKTGEEYLIESLYCPNCYVVVGQGINGTHDLESPEPMAHRPPISLTDFEIVAVITYLQYWDSDLNSKITAKEDWEHYFNKRLIISPSS